MFSSSSVTIVAISTMTLRCGIEPGHLEIHPDEHGAASYLAPGSASATVRTRARDSARPPGRGPSGSELSRGSATRAVTWSHASARSSRPAVGARTIPTGIALGIPEGYAGLRAPEEWARRPARRHVPERAGPDRPWLSRRGCGHTCEHDPGTPYEVHRGDRIAQLVICRVEEVRFVAVDRLDTSERGAGGFGHSGR